MRKKPAYFKNIYNDAKEMWDKFEEKPDWGGSMRQLFKQVQSPRHVVSELLQNADDADAKEVSVRVEDNVFIFEHDGKDFNKEQFQSLCRFGYSNKRVLHTIGFRGIGFKSTFSLGEPVKLNTPSLSVQFLRERFTQPHWLDNQPQVKGKTIIQVPIKDENIISIVEKNFSDWIENPFSLLFFRNIKKLHIQGQEIEWKTVETIAPRITLMALANDTDKIYLHAKSEEINFPEQAVEEIIDERIDEGQKKEKLNEQLNLSVCQVEIIMTFENSLNGKIYAILPTELKTKLPFSCNAPFMQDPSRHKILEPESSPTNKWLLEQVGKLAAETMLQYLGNKDLEERIKAYNLMPNNFSTEVDSLEGRCAEIIKESFENAITDEPVLLTEEGELVNKNEGVYVDNKIAKIWGLQKTIELLSDEEISPLHSNISNQNLQKLSARGWIEKIERNEFFTALKKDDIPQPASWQQLAYLWDYVREKIDSYYSDNHYSYDSKLVILENLRIVPVQSESVLYSENSVVRLGNKKFKSDSDKDFLSQHLNIVNIDWLKFLDDRKKETENLEGNDEYIVLKQETSTNIVMDRFFDKFNKKENKTVAEFVQIAQIAANLGVRVNNFFYCTQGNYIRSKTHDIIYDGDGSLKPLIPEELHDEHLLHPDYLNFDGSTSCTEENWQKWVESGQSGLHILPPLKETSERFYSRNIFSNRLEEYGYIETPDYQYRSSNFQINDWNFANEYWEHWRKLAESDERLWVRLTDILIKLSDADAKSKIIVKVIHIANDPRHTKPLSLKLVPIWIRNFRDLRCLPDINDNCYMPYELLRLTHATSSQLGVNPFIHERWQDEKFIPLLNLLGVSSTPLGPEKLLERLHSLLKAEKLLLNEIDKLYSSIKNYLNNCSEEQEDFIRKAFQEENLILTASGNLENSQGVFLNDGGLTGLPVIHEFIRENGLWYNLDITVEPTHETIIEWLKGYPPESVETIRSSVKKYPSEIWVGCQHWFNLSGQWVPIENFKYSALPDFPISHLSSNIKNETADFKDLSRDDLSSVAFSNLLSLSEHITEHLESDISSASNISDGHAWLHEIGKALCRIKSDNEENDDKEDFDNVCALGEKLLNSDLIELDEILIVPYMNDEPIGSPRKTDIAWLQDNKIYIKKMKNPALARKLPEEISKSFKGKLAKKIATALHHNFARDEQYVQEYMEENFSLSNEIVMERQDNKEKISLVSESEQQESKVAQHEETPSPPSRSIDPLNPPHRGFDGFTIAEISATARQSNRPLNDRGHEHVKKTESPVQSRNTRYSVNVSMGKKRNSNPETEPAAIKAVIAYEKEYGFDAKDMNVEDPNHHGYDIESSGNGETRLIEVKGLKGSWEEYAVSISRTQVKCNLAYPNKFWLYVVEFALEIDQQKIYCIKNPIDFIDNFDFDAEWCELLLEMRKKV